MLAMKGKLRDEMALINCYLLDVYKTMRVTLIVACVSCKNVHTARDSISILFFDLEWDSQTSVVSDVESKQLLLSSPLLTE